MKMTKEQLKPLIKMVLMEMARRRRTGSSGEYEDYEIELDNLTIPGVCTEGDYVLITTTIEYDADPGYEGRYYGPPENCYPGEGPSIEIVNQYPTSLKVTNEAGQEIEIDDLTKLAPEQLQILNAVVEKYVSDNASDIESKILDTIDFDYDPRDEPDYDR